MSSPINSVKNQVQSLVERGELGDIEEVCNWHTQKEWMFFGCMAVKMAPIWQSRTQSTTICLFSDYDLPLPCKSFITVTHLGRPQFKCRLLSFSEPQPRSHPLSDSKPRDSDRSCSRVSHIPSTSFLLNVLDILPYYGVSNGSAFI